MSMLHTPRTARDAVTLAEARRLATGGGRLIREGADLSLGDVARACGVHASTIMRWERGDVRPTGEAALRYAELLRDLSRRGTR
jgi:DNA-binding transcriptional regulator YiaG